MKIKRRSGAALFEIMMAIGIAMYIFFCAWAMNMIAWTWWYDISPHSECQRIARVAISVIGEGMRDPNAGTDFVNFATYSRRRGFGWAVRSNAAENMPTISDNGPDIGHKIEFRLESDPVNTQRRSYYLGQDSSGAGVVYYKYWNNQPQMIKATRGITDLTFERVLTDDGKDYSTVVLYKITATASKTVRGLVKSASYTEYLFMRNL